MFNHLLLLSLFLGLLMVDTFNGDVGVDLGRINIEASHIGWLSNRWNLVIDCMN